MPQNVPYPSQLLRDMLRTYWDTSKFPRPIIIEKPPPDYIRADLYNVGPHILVEAGDLRESLIHIGFSNLDIQVPMSIEIHTAGHPDEFMSDDEVETNRFRHQLLYDYAREIQRIILTNQHDPNAYLIDNFENISTPRESWSFADATGSIDTSIKKYGTQSLKIENTTSTTQDVAVELPSYIEDEDNELPLIPRFSDRLRAIKYNIRADVDDTSLDVLLRTTDGMEDITLLSETAGTKWKEYDRFIDLLSDKSVENIDDNTEVSIVFQVPRGATIWLDQMVLSTCEYQMLLYESFLPDNSTFGYHTGRTRAMFRSVGDAIDRLI